MPRRSSDLLVPLLTSSVPVTLDQLQLALKASRATTFRYLSKLRHIRSYNHNGRFYTALDPARFDRFGLLSLGDIHFSLDGSLSATVQRLVAESRDGFSDQELRDLLHVTVQPFLLRAVRKGLAVRERLGRAYVYFSADGQTAARQRHSRQARLDARLAATLDPHLVIEVLLTLLRHPGSLPGQVARRLQGRSPPISLAQVQAVFDRFDLLAIAKKGGSMNC